MTPQDPPVEIDVKVGKDNVTDIVKCVLGCENDPIATNCDLGVLYSERVSGADEGVPRNQLATRVRYKYSTMTADRSVLNGRCMLVGEDKEGLVVNVEKKAKDNVFSLYEEMTGHSVTRRGKTVRVGPKKPKRAFDYFAKEFQTSRRAELKAQNIVPVFQEITMQARSAWAAMSDEDKVKYETEAEKDRQRYETEKEAWKKANPPPPKHPRNAFNMFCVANPKSERPSWKSLTKEEKAPYLIQAEEDKNVRYPREMEIFRKHCEETGKDFHALTDRKPRKSVKRKVESNEEDETEEKEVPPKKKRKTVKKNGDNIKKPRKKKTKKEASENKDDGDVADMDEA